MLGFVVLQPSRNLKLSLSFLLASHAGKRQPEIVVSLA